ncbi:MAG: hypothetical protein ACFB5Z_07465, partial [Elainellaceae cyanobacterium]
MKRIITATVSVIAIAAFASPSIALSGRHAEESHEGLGNKLSGRFEEEFKEGFGNKNSGRCEVVVRVWIGKKEWGRCEEDIF